MRSTGRPGPFGDQAIATRFIGNLATVNLLLTVCGVFVYGLHGPALAGPAVSVASEEPGQRDVLIRSATDTGLSADVVVPAPVVGTDVGFTTVAIEGYGTLHRAGEPALPVRTVRFAVPIGSDPRVRIDAGPESTLAAGVAAPFPTVIHPNGVTGEGTGDVTLERIPDPSIYGGSVRFPAEPVTVRTGGVLRGVPYVEVILTPVHFEPGAQRIGYYPRIRIDVDFLGQKMPGEDEVAIPPPSAPFRGAWDRAFANPKQALRVAGSPRRLSPAGRPGGGTLPTRREAGFDGPAGGRITGPAAATSSLGSASTRYKLSIDRDGVYRLDHPWVVANAPDLLTHAPASYRVMDLGIELPITVVDHDMDGTFDSDASTPDYIEFYGQALTWDILDPDEWNGGNRYTNTNVYWLDAGISAGLRAATLDGSPVNAYTEPSDFPETIHHEVDDLFIANIPSATVDHWYERPGITTADGTPEAQTYPVRVPDPSTATTQAAIRVRLLGDNYNNNFHRTNVSVNGTIVDGCGDGIAGCGNQGGGCVDWDGFTFFTHGVDNGTVNFCQADLTASTDVTIEVPLGRVENSQAITTDFVYMDWIEISYGRKFRAEDSADTNADGTTDVGGSLRFTYSNTDARFRVTNLPTSDVVIYELSGTLSDPNLVSPVLVTNATVSGAGPYEALFEVGADGGLPSTRTFIVTSITPDGRTGDLLPEAVGVYVPGDIVSPSTGADWLVVSDTDLMDPSPTSPFQMLVDYRSTTQGKRVKTVTVEQIYDEFSFGIFDPQAIRDFLDNAYDNWPLGPSGERLADVLFLGDATFDYMNNYEAPEKRIWVPTYMRTEPNNTFVSYLNDDVYFGRVDGVDELPDINIGRIPAHSMAEANVVCDKILDYEQQAPGAAWHGNVVMVAENKDIQFRDISESTRLEFLDGTAHTTNKIYMLDLEPQFDTNMDGTLSSTEQQNLADETRDLIQRNLDGNPDGTRDIGPGASVISFVGHGSWQNWAKIASIFRTKSVDPDDVDPLSNSTELPLMFISNCLSGGFHVTHRPGGSNNLTYALTEDFLTTPGKGAVAAIAPGQVTFTHNVEIEFDSVFGEMFGQRKTRHLGEIAQALRESFDISLAYVELRSFSLLGDPAMTLIMPAPIAPTNLSVTSEGDQQVSLSWTASPDASSYKLYRADLPGGPYFEIGSPAGTTFVDTGLTNCNTYYYQATSVDGGGFEGARSNENADCPGAGDCVSGTPLKPTAPGQPTGVVVTDPEDGRTLELSWSANPGNDEVTNYVVRWSKVPGDPNPPNSAGTSLTFFTISDLEEGERYYITVAAANCSQGEGPRSLEVSEIPIKVKGIKPPRWISDLMASRLLDGDGSDDVLLEWTLPATDIWGKAESLMEVRVYHNASGPQFSLSPGNLLSTELASAEQFEHEDAFSDASEHYYLVVTVDTDGNRSGGGHELPKGIDDLMAACSGGDCGAASQIILTWGAITEDLIGQFNPAASYRVYGQNTVFNRADTEVMVPISTTTTNSDTVSKPVDSIFFWSVIVQDQRGSDSPW